MPIHINCGSYIYEMDWKRGRSDLGGIDKSEEIMSYFKC